MEDEDFEFENEISHIRENLINWFPFDDNSDILEITSNSKDDITNFLNNISNNFQKVILKDEKIKKLDNEKKFDYIIIHNIDGIKKEYNSLNDILLFSRLYLKTNGTILISIKNRLGVQTINTTEIKNNLDFKNRNLYSKKEIIDELNKNFENAFSKFYYILPNEDCPNVIFTDEYLPNSESILRDLILYNKFTIIKEDERDLYKQLINEDPELFKIFANSFLVEISYFPIKTDVKYVSFGNSRKEEYRLKTIINKNYAYKEAITSSSLKQINGIKKNIEILNNSNINCLDEYKDEKIYSKLVKNSPTFDQTLINLYDSNKDEFYTQINLFKVELENKLEKSCDLDNTAFEKYGIKCDKKMNEKLNYVKYGMFDLIFQNCFVIDNKFWFFDQEWEVDNLPLEFIIYRAILYLGNSYKKIDVNELYKNFGIENYISVFNKLENVFQEKIKDKNIWDIHRLVFERNIKITYDTMNHSINLLSQKNSELQNECESLKKEKENLENKIRLIENSTSWKITKPLRKIKKYYKKEDKKWQERD